MTNKRGIKPSGARHVRLKGVGGMTAWSRAVRDTNTAMEQHLGGADLVTVPEQMLIRRVAVFEAEMRLMEAKIGQDRQAGRDPDEKFVDLYSRLVNAQRRLLEGVGMKRVPRTIVPSLEEYVILTARPAGET
jgi:hypothetical protein